MKLPWEDISELVHLIKNERVIICGAIQQLKKADEKLNRVEESLNRIVEECEG